MPPAPPITPLQDHSLKALRTSLRDEMARWGITPLQVATKAHGLVTRQSVGFFAKPHTSGDRRWVPEPRWQDLVRKALVLLVREHLEAHLAAWDPEAYAVLRPPLPDAPAQDALVEAGQ